LEPTRLAALHEAKARALVRDTFGVAAPTPITVPSGAAFVDGDRIWVYVPGNGRRALGRALVLADREQRAQVHLIVDEDDGVAARQGAQLEPPARVWRVDGTSLVASEPAPLPLPMEPPYGADHLVAMLRDAGTEISVEHGTIHGEVRGLEVARVRVGDEGTPTLDVGIGRFDQEATALLHGHLPTPAALARAVEEVRKHRRGDAMPHPVNRLARERWLRAQVIDDPAVIGLTQLAAIAPVVPRLNVRDPHPAAALGVDAAGRRVLVVASVGVDLDLVPVAADLAARERPDEIVLVTPARDQVPAQLALAARLRVPTRFAAVGGSWPGGQ
jgi:hypothetical protein